MRLPFLIQYTVNTEGARSGNGQQQVTARNGQVFHEHQGVHAFRKVAMEQERGQQRKARSEQRGGPGQETEQNRQTAAELKEDGQRQQRDRGAREKEKQRAESSKSRSSRAERRRADGEFCLPFLQPPFDLFPLAV